MRNALAILVLASVGLIAQGQTTGNATAATCSIANSGHNVTNLTIQCGVGQQQGQKIISILNKILANQLDFSAVMAKLNEIEAAQKAAQASKGEVTGTDNTIVNDSRSVRGNGNTILGGDGNGNVNTPGGTAIGRDAHATDKSSVAIGAGAGAGNTQSSGSADCPNNVGNCAGVNNGTQIVQGYIPPPFRVVTQPDVTSAIQALKNAQTGGVSFTYIGSTDDPEISAFFRQIRDIFVKGHWQTVGMRTVGEMNNNVNGAISHGEGFNCTVDGSAAGAAAKEAMEIAGYECTISTIQAPMVFSPGRPGMAPPPTPNVEISIGTRIVPQR